MKRFILLISLLLFISWPSEAAAKTERLIVFNEGILNELSSPTLYKGQIQLKPLNDQTVLATFPQSTQQSFTTLENILLQSPFIQSVEHDELRFIDEQIATFEESIPTQQWWVDSLEMPTVWNYGKQYATNEVTIAVIDSGVSRKHPDLQSERILPGYDFVTGTAVQTDPNGHGTAIVGLLQGTSNPHYGVQSLLHEYPVNVLPLRTMNEKGITSISSIIRAINYAIQENVDVINLSLGGSSPIQAEQLAIEKALNHGILVVASAGNDALKGNPMNYPAAYPGVIAVGSTTPQGKRAPFSNIHSYVDFVAPGTQLLTTNLQEGYSLRQGTSFSTPFVSALVSMIRTIDPKTTQDVIYDTLKQTARPLSLDIPSKEYGHGEIRFVETLQPFIYELPKVVWSSDEWQLPIQTAPTWKQIDDQHYAILLEVGESINFRDTMSPATTDSPIVSINGQLLHANAVGSARITLYQLYGPTKTIDVKVTESRKHTIAGFTKDKATWQSSSIERASVHPDGLIHLTRPGDVQISVETEGKTRSMNQQITGEGIQTLTTPHEIRRPKSNIDQLTILFNEPVTETFVKEAISLSTDERNEHPWTDVSFVIDNKRVHIYPKTTWPNTPLFIHVNEQTLHQKVLSNPRTVYFQVQQ